MGGPLAPVTLVFPDGSVCKEFICNAGDTGDADWIPGSGRSPRGENGNPLQYSGWKILWTEKPGGLQPMGSQRAGHD